jgi:hypothetical protein
LAVPNVWSISVAFHVEIDGVNVTGSVPVPMTQGWNDFHWVTKAGPQVNQMLVTTSSP